jgi:hypothetical protein
MHKQRIGGRSRPRQLQLTAVVLLTAALPTLMAVPAAAAGKTPAHHAANTPSAAIRRDISPKADRPIPNAAAAKAAQVQARESGTPVTITADTTAVSQTRANPNGSFTSIITALPTRVRENGRWVAISARLLRTRQGQWRTAAATEPTTLSGGGKGPLAVLTNAAGAKLSLWFPVRLPRPVITGASATYRSVRPGVDLRVTASADGGISEQLIVRTRAAADGSWLRTFAQRYSSPGLRLASDAAGNVQAIGAHGVVAFNSSPPLIVSPIRQAGPARHPASRPVVAGPDQLTNTVRARVSHSEIVMPLRGSQFGPRASYPVTISISVATDSGAAASAPSGGRMSPDVSISSDPAKASVSGYDEAQDVGEPTSSSCSGVKNWKSTSVTKLGIGDNAFGSAGTCNSIGYYQSYYVFDTSSINNSAYVIDTAELQLTVVYSAFEACNDAKEPVYLHSMGGGSPIGSGSDGANVSALGTSSTVVDVNPAENDESPSCGNQTAKYTVTGNMQDATTQWTYGISGNNATTGYGFMRLSDNPSLDITFDEVPAKPGVDQSSPTMKENPSDASTADACSTADLPPFIGTSGSIQLNADFTAGISGEDVMPWWSVKNSAGTVTQTTADTKQVAQGEHDYVISSPVNGDEYFWDAKTMVDANDTSLPEQTSSELECSFVVDGTQPTMPAVSSSAFPPSGSTPGTTQVVPGASGTFNFSASDPPPSGCSSSFPIADGGFSFTEDTCIASGVYEFEYSLNQQLSSTVTALGSGGTDNCGTQSGAVPAVNPTGDPNTDTSANPSATTTATSCTIDISQWGTNTLYVAAVDQAGNVSQSYDYTFYVPFSQQATTEPGDVNGDGIPDLLATNSAGNLVLYPGNTDPTLTPPTASVAADAPSVSGLNWSQEQIAHRGSWSGGDVDDLLVLDQPDGNLYLYKNGGTPTGMFETTTNQNLITFPSCGTVADPDNTNNCSGYPSLSAGWLDFNQILVPGDAWGGASGGTTSITEDTGKPSLLAVDPTTGALWLFQGTGGALQNPVQLGASGWNDVTLLAPGDVNGQLTLWARVNSGTDAGDVVSFPLAIPAGHAPTLDPAAPGTLESPTSGTVLDNSGGTAISLPVASYPQVVAPAPLSGGTCSTTDTLACPGLYAVSSSGELFFYAGQATTTPADALTGTSAEVGDIGTGIIQLS